MVITIILILISFVYLQEKKDHFPKYATSIMITKRISE